MTKSQDAYSPTITQPGNASSPDHHTTLFSQGTVSNCGYVPHSAPQARAEGTYDQLARPFHPPYSLPELRPMHSPYTQLLKTEVSSPGSLRQAKRARHHYEEIDHPDYVKGDPGSHLSSACNLAHSSNPPSTLPSYAHGIGPSAEASNVLSDCTGSPVYENVSQMLHSRNGSAVEQRPPARLQQPQQNAPKCKEEDEVLKQAHQLHPDCHSTDTSRFSCGSHRHSVASREQTVLSEVDATYDRPRAPLYSTPVSSDREVVTLNARRGCMLVSPLNLPLEGASEILYCNLQSSKTGRLSDDIYEEIDSAIGYPRTQFESSSPDHLNSGSRCTYTISASLTAQQLATEEGYELVASRQHVVSHSGGYKHEISGRWSQSDIGQESPEQLYINQQLHKKLATDHAVEEESDSYVVVRSPNTPPLHSGLAGDRSNRGLPESSAYQVPGPISCAYVNTVKCF